MRTILTAVGMFAIAATACVSILRQQRGKRTAGRNTKRRPAMDHDAFGAAHYPLELAVLASDVRRAVAKHYRRNLSRIVPTDRLDEDLHLYDREDPMPVHDLLMHMENAFSIYIPDEDAETVKTFDDLVQCIARRRSR